MGEDDEWPSVQARVLDSDILVIATPTWLGQPSSVAKLALERLDSMISMTDDDERPVAFNKVAGVIVTGNEDGAHHVIAEVSSALVDIGFTIPGQSWTYWNMGPGPGPSYTQTDTTGHARPDGRWRPTSWRWHPPFAIDRSHRPAERGRPPPGREQCGCSVILPVLLEL